MDVVKERSNADLAAMTLDELAAEANREYMRGAEAANHALYYWMRSGEILLTVKDRLLPSDWIQWLETQWNASVSWGQFCVRLATYKDEVEASGTKSVREAKQLMAGLPPVAAKRGLDETPHLKRQAQELKEAGWSRRSIAEELGKHPSTISKWLNPQTYEKAKRANRDYARRRKAADRLLHKERNAKEIAKRKDPVSDAYSMIRKLTQVVDQGKAEVQDREGKEALRRAEDLLHQADAAIVRALGLK